MNKTRKILTLLGIAVFILLAIASGLQSDYNSRGIYIPYSSGRGGATGGHFTPIGTTLLVLLVVYTGLYAVTGSKTKPVQPDSKVNKLEELERRLSSIARDYEGWKSTAHSVGMIALPLLRENDPLYPEHKRYLTQVIDEAGKEGIGTTDLPRPPGNFDTWLKSGGKGGR